MTTPTPTYYHILNLPSPLSTQEQHQSRLSKQDLKLAYHRALLRYHPDKSSASSTRTKSTKPSVVSNGEDERRRVYTIDEITTAYKTLSDPKARAEYDRELRLSRHNQADGGGRENGEEEDIFHTGLETVDLEDLGYVDSGEDGYWYRSCRCGDQKGFFVTEEDLEREVEAGEILVGCKGCSLWLGVLFAVVEDDGGLEREEDGVS